MKPKSAAGGVLPGAAAFKLYDTFGLALDEQEEMARERGPRHRSRGLQRRDGKAAHARSRQLEGRGQDADRSGLQGPSAPPNSSAARRWKSRVKVLAVIEHDGRRNWFSTARRFMPKPAARWAIPACCSRRNRRDASPSSRSRTSRRPERHRPSEFDRWLPVSEGDKP